MAQASASQPRLRVPSATRLTPLCKTLAAPSGCGEPQAVPHAVPVEMEEPQGVGDLFRKRGLAGPWGATDQHEQSCAAGSLPRDGHARNDGPAAACCLTAAMLRASLAATDHGSDPWGCHRLVAV